MNEKKIVLTERKRKQYERNAEIIKFYRRNPVIACEDLLGIKLMDSQKLVLMNTWNTKNNVWCCSRNFGKSFLLDVVGALKILLYPNIKVYIVSSKGNQSIETYLKLEDIAKQRIESIPTLKDIFISEVKQSNNSDGFIHDKGSHKVTMLNNSSIFTLNSVPDNVRGKRAQLLLIDESGFTSEELINIVLPFIAQKTDFKLGIGEDFNTKIMKKAVPTQVIFSSSASEADHIYAQKYKEFSIKMLAGDSNYYVADIPCDVPLKPMVDGEFVSPLLEQSEVDDMLKTNPDRAMREFFNKFQKDGGSSQIVKLSQIRKAETFQKPVLFSTEDGEMFAIAMDSALQHDNSIIGVMQIFYDENRGYYGKIVNCMNLVDIFKHDNIQIKSQEQMDRLKQCILDYNMDSKGDYRKISKLLVDAGHSTMLTFLDLMLANWTDKENKKHRGFIDSKHPRYIEEKRNYPDAWDNVDAVSPQKYRKEMVEDFIDLMREGLVEFPEEYNHKGYIVSQDENGEYKKIQLTQEEELALTNIDIMKTEITSIHKGGTRENPKYDLSKDKARKMHDDRFYVAILLGRHLTELRRQDQLNKTRGKKKFDPKNAPSCVTKVAW